MCVLRCVCSHVLYCFVLLVHTVVLCTILFFIFSNRDMHAAHGKCSWPDPAHAPTGFEGCMPCLSFDCQSEGGIYGYDLSYLHLLLLLQVVAMSAVPYQAQELKLQEEDLCR